VASNKTRKLFACVLIFVSMKNLRLTFGKPNVCHIKGMEKKPVFQNIISFPKLEISIKLSKVQ